jgi:branched-chain amino acid transport system ATP-binding protein
MDGQLWFDGEDVTHLPPWETAARGLGYVPQEKGIFPELTVLENLQVGAMIGSRSPKERIDEIVSLFPDIGDRRNQRAGTLSGGESQMLATGRALMQDPKLILLDEPTAGLSPRYVDNLFEKIRDIRQTRDVAIVVAEQNAAKALEVADRVMVLTLGEASAISNASEVTIETLREGYGI